MIAHSAELKPDRFQEAVRTQADRLRLNLKLTTLNLALPTIEARMPVVQPEELYRLLSELEMRSSLNEARIRYGQPELF